MVWYDVVWTVVIKECTWYAYFYVSTDLCWLFFTYVLRNFRQLSKPSPSLAGLGLPWRDWADELVYRDLAWLPQCCSICNSKNIARKIPLQHYKYSRNSSRADPENEELNGLVDQALELLKPSPPPPPHPPPMKKILAANAVHKGSK